MPAPWNEQVIWSFPNEGSGKAYRIFGGAPDVPKDPNLGDTGPARVGSFRNDSTYGDFMAAVDIVNYDDSIFQNIGFIAGRVNLPGLLTTSGYLAGYARSLDNRDQQATFALVEFQTELNVSAPNQYTGGAGLVSRLNPAGKYRMVFTAAGANLKAAIYNRTDLLEPLIKIAGNNADIGSGTAGIGALSYDGDNDKAADFTFDNYYSSASPNDPVGFPGMAQAVELVPAAQTLFYSIPATNRITFAVRTFTANQIATNQLKMFLNGADVSSQLVLSNRGTILDPAKANFGVRYTGSLASNTIYNGQIIVVDTNGIGTTNNFVFDTFATNGSLLVEAEDYNFGGGGYQDNPPVSGLDAGGNQINGGGTGYYGALGTREVDYHDTDTRGTPDVDYSQYRSGDFVGTAQGIYAGDTPRPDHVATNVPDYALWRMQAGEWLNYTRTFPANNWNVYLRTASQAREDVRFDLVTGDRTQPNQTTALRGNFLVPNTGSSTRFRYVPLTDAVGNPQVISFAGLTTFRMTALGGLDSDRQHGGDDFGSLEPTYFLFVPAATPAPTTPWVAVASPSAGATDVPLQPTVQIVILNRTTSVNCPGSIQLRLDGNNVTSAATISCSTSEGPGATVTYNYPTTAYLQPNTTHTLSLVFSDGVTTQSNQWSFTTANVPLIPAAFALASSPGTNFTVQIHKAPNDGDNDSFPNSSSRAERQLANRLYDPNSGASPVVYTNEAANTPTNYGFYIEPVAINYEQCGNSAGFFPDDNNFPGIYPTNYVCPGDGANHFAMAASIKMRVPAGLYRMGVRSDDGFKVTVGTNDNPVTVGPALSPAVLLGIAEGGRGSVETTFDFVVAANGVYNFRLLYYEGTGGADCEWYWVNRLTGARELVRPVFLESSATVTGPYTLENGALIDPGAKTVTLPKAGDTRFYRLRSTTRYTLSAPTFSGSNVVMTYQ